MVRRLWGIRDYLTLDERQTILRLDKPLATEAS